MCNKNLKVSVIILNYNGMKLGELLDECMKSVLNTNYQNFEVIFVDNASGDGSYEHVKSEFPQMKFLRNAKNFGFAKGNNIGVQNCEGEIIVFLNYDTIVDPNWLKEPLELLRNSKVRIVQSNLRCLNDPKVSDSIGIVLSAFGFPIEKNFLGIKQNESVPIFSGKGAALFVMRDLFEELGGFDEDYFMWFEDSDLCWRARLLRYETYFAPSSIVYHKGGEGTFKNSKLFFHRQKNTIASIIKNYELQNLIIFLPLRLTFELASIFFLVVNRKPALAVSDVKSLLWIVRNFTKLLRKRAEVQRSRKIKDKEFFERNLILKSFVLTIKYLKSRFERAKMFSQKSW